MHIHHELDYELIKHVLDRADQIHENQENLSSSMNNTSIASFFMQPSTRTRASFAKAVWEVGAGLIEIPSAESSMEKSETLEDTMMVLDAMGIDFLVIRQGDVLEIPTGMKFLKVINAGDALYHPTQGLLDAYTLQQFGEIRGIVVGVVGDVRHSRVYNSNKDILTKLGAQVIYSAPPGFDIEEAPNHSPDFLFKSADAIMALRPQRSRMRKELYGPWRVTKELAKGRPVLHPGPISGDRYEMDDDAITETILKQVTNGVLVRAALLLTLARYNLRRMF